MALHIIVNPEAGARRSHTAVRPLLRQAEALGWATQVHQPPDATATTQIVDDVRTRAETDRSTPSQTRIVAVGGDGIVNLVADRLVGSRVPLGIVATGTGNDIARGLGLEANAARSPDVAAAAALGPSKAVDVLRCRSGDGAVRHVVSVATLGFSADVNARANTMRWPRGASRYTIATLLELIRPSVLDLRLEITGQDPPSTGGRESEQSFQTRALFVCVANTPFFGGGIEIAPGADPTDAALDAVTVQTAPRHAVLRLFPAARRGGHTTDPRVRLDRGAKIVVSSPSGELEPVSVRGDGEAVGTLPMTIDVVPASLWVASFSGTPR